MRWYDNDCSGEIDDGVKVFTTQMKMETGSETTTTPQNSVLHKVDIHMGSDCNDNDQQFIQVLLKFAMV